jgi:hypothetical protein
VSSSVCCHGEEDSSEHSCYRSVHAFHDAVDVRGVGRIDSVSDLQALQQMFQDHVQEFQSSIRLQDPREHPCIKKYVEDQVCDLNGSLGQASPEERVPSVNANR